MADPPFAVLRADADPNIGMGHLMRTLALGEGLVELGWRVALAFNAPPEVAPATETASIAWSPVSGHTGTVEDALQVAALEPDLVVVDGYQFDASFYVELGDRGCRYAVIDDNGETSARDPVLVLNQNPHAAASTYAHLPSSRLLLGLEFALLRRAIRDIEAEGGGAEHRARVLVSIGGSDPLGLTVPVVTLTWTYELRSDHPTPAEMRFESRSRISSARSRSIRPPMWLSWQVAILRSLAPGRRLGKPPIWACRPLGWWSLTINVRRRPQPIWLASHKLWMGGLLSQEP